HLGERSRRNGVVEAPEPVDEGSGEVVRACAHHLAELDEESGEVDAEVVQPERDVIVHALPDLGRRGAAEPFAQIEPAIADDRRQGGGGEGGQGGGGKAAQHHQPASGTVRGSDRTRARRGAARRSSMATSATRATAAPAPKAASQAMAWATGAPSGPSR